MTDQKSLDRIRQLLLTFPGVTSAIVVRTPLRTDTVSAHFRCTDTHSMKRIAVAAYWSNVSVRLSNHEMRPCGEPADADGVAFVAWIPEEWSDVPTPPEIFGVYLSVELEKMRLMTTEEVDELHSQWNTRLASRHGRPPKE